MENLKILYNKYQNKKLLLTGDFNARIGDIEYNDPTISYDRNPDITINSNGRQLLKWKKYAKDMLLVNGLRYKNKNFDTDYTFYRGRSKSQNDLAFTNNIQSTKNISCFKKYRFKLFGLFF